MCVEIIQNDHNFLGQWIKLIGKMFHHSCPFDPPALLGL